MWHRLSCALAVLYWLAGVMHSMSLHLQPDEKANAFQFINFHVGAKDDQCDSQCASLGMEPLLGAPFAVGDPHLRNIHGQGFDILRSGISTLLQYPLQKDTEQHGQDKLRVDASVEHPGNESSCKGYFILRMWIRGSLVGEQIELSTSGRDLFMSDALVVKIAGKAMRNSTEIKAFKTNGKYKMAFNDERDNNPKRHLNNRIKFAALRLNIQGVGLEVNWFTGKRQPNRLDFRAEHLSKLGKQFGGLLGDGDHSWVSSYDPSCKKSPDFGKFEQLTAATGQPWYATANLD